MRETRTIPTVPAGGKVVTGFYDRVTGERLKAADGSDSVTVEP